MKHREILLIGILPPPINGQTIAFHSLSKELSCEILTLSGQRHENLSGFLGKSWTYLSVLVTLFFKLIRKKYVIYHTISQSKEGFLRDFPIVILAKFFGSKIILHIHGGNYDNFYATQNDILQKLILKMLTSANSIIVLSEGLKKMLDFAPTLNPKIKVVNNGLAWSASSKYQKIKRLPSNLQIPINILFLSNLIESKGYWSVLEAIEILVNQFKINIQADFCGEFIHYDDAIRFENASDAERHFFEFISKHQLSNHVKYHGIIDEQTKIELLQKAHFFILPTQYKNEGQPISIIEAMAYSCVVLTTNFRGISEMIEHHKSGIFVEYNNPNSIVKQFIHLIENPQIFEKISQNSLQKFQEKYTKELHLKQLVEVIKSHTKPQNAIDFHSEIAFQFQEKYKKSKQFKERYFVWTSLIDKYIYPDMSVLDVGCGSGIFSHYLATKKCKVTGIDGSEKMIELCQNNYAQENVTLSFLQDDLPFQNHLKYAKKEAIICSSVLEYLPDYKKITIQISQILNANGILIVSMPNQDCWYRKIEKYIFQITGKPDYFPHLKQVVKAEAFSKELSDLGFELKELQYYPNTHFYTKLFHYIGIHKKYTHTIFVGVYQLNSNH
ncbi:glycosyltransferase involved in cell wall biosynthesis [Arcicella aurantiaca]|uniref:Glycosyltransferase involved in cell wall biosynthesis n=1 Tax=Arcicella aurantiaca TaxID=591202 RepID=A0A316EEA4_9BACT|nr:glycosyltransferase [Arcicella aurantiaca]PWK28980.1 glycosyltransferase involved in cell wall biosynthesis [Arcicella aurantiaca]